MNYDVKKQILLIAALTYLSSCANLRKLGDESQAYPSTMTSDLNSTELSRTDYNTKIADNYLEKKLFEQAVDQYRLALLHDNKNTKARFGLAQSYSNLEQNETKLKLNDKAKNLTTINLICLKFIIQNSPVYDDFRLSILCHFQSEF